jgi:predicted transposase/invertase (TIGR01784 family)
MDSNERKHYENYIQNRIIEQNVIETARIDRKKEGLKEGLQKGIQTGENQAKLTIAHKMLESGMDIKTIATFTGLNVEILKQVSKVNDQ